MAVSDGSCVFKSQLKLHEWGNYFVSTTLMCPSSKIKELIKPTLLDYCEDNLCKALGISESLVFSVTCRAISGEKLRRK